MRELGYAALTEFLRSVANGELRVVRLEVGDLRRTAELLDRYSDGGVDLVDCCIVALSERLGLDRILTVDRRHFGLFRPRHRSHLTLLP